MNDSTAAVDNPSEIPPTVASNAKKIVAVCVLLVVVRIYMFWVSKQSFAAQDFSWTATLATTFAVIVTAFIAASVTQRWFGKLISFLSSIVFGAIASLHFVSPFGAFIGGIVGFFVVFDFPRKCFGIATRWFAKVGFWTFAVGMTSGCLFLKFAFSQNQHIQVATILGCLSICFVVGTVVVYLKKSTGGSKLKWVYVATCSLLAGFLALIAGWVVGIETVNQYSYYQLRNTGGSAVFDLTDPSLWLTQGMTTCHYAHIGEHATDESMKALMNMNAITFLSIDSESITDDGFRFIPKNPLLQRISIENANLTDDAFVVLGSSRSIYALNLARLAIGDEAIEHLGTKPFLRQLQLSDTRITDRSMKRIGKYARLQYLTVRSTQITDKGLAELTSPILQTLDLAHTKVQGPGLAQLAKLPALQWLDLSYTDLESKYLELLTPSRSISSLVLDGIKIDARATDALCKRGNYQRLSIAKSGISDADAKRLPPINHLTIDCLHLTPSTVRLIIQKQSQSSYDSELDLRLDNQLLSSDWIERMSQFGVEVTCSNCTVDLAAVEALEKQATNVQLHFNQLKIDDKLYDRLNKILGVAIGSRDESWQNKNVQSTAK